MVRQRYDGGVLLFNFQSRSTRRTLPPHLELLSVHHQLLSAIILTTQQKKQNYRKTADVSVGKIMNRECLTMHSSSARVEQRVDCQQAKLYTSFAVKESDFNVETRCCSRVRVAIKATFPHFGLVKKREGKVLFLMNGELSFQC